MFEVSIFNAFVVLFLYLAARTVYRLYFHPLSKFPGPLLAISTRLYEWYFEFVKGGKFWEEIGRMHERYGPIVRINHFELHISDPEYYDQIYNFNPDLDKRQYPFENVQLTADHALHKHRRRVLEPFFSRQSVQSLEHVIQNAVSKLVNNLETARRTNEPAEVSLMYRCMTADIITDCLLSWEYGFLEKLDDAKDFLRAFDFRPLIAMREVPGFWKLLTTLRPYLAPFNDQAQAIMKWRSQLHLRVLELTGDEAKTVANTNKVPIMKLLLGKDLPEEEKRPALITESCRLFVSAGIETTGFALSTAHYHLLSKPALAHRLKQELIAAWPNADVPLTWSELEKLPFLKACIQEAIRISTGVMARLSRVNNKSDMQLGPWTIPRGTPVSMSQPYILWNEKIYERPLEYLPERWLDLSPEKARYMEKYMVSFSKGSRVCMGKHLAQLEMFTALATVFRRFDMQLHEARRDTVYAARDYFVAYPEVGDQLVSIKVK